MNLSKITWVNGTTGAWLLVAVAFGCSGNTSLGGAADSGVGGSSRSGNSGGATGTSVKQSAGGDCGLMECFRAYECVEQCGGPVINSGCCPCGDGTIDRVTACVGVGGNKSIGGSTATGGDMGSYSPCGGKRCGDVCTMCPPGSATCVETNLLKACDSQGTCMGSSLVQCTASGGAPGTGGASSTKATGSTPATGGASSTSAYQPCAGKKCGDNCTLCPPNSTDCGETAVMKSCDLAGQCLAGTQQCTTATGGSTGAGGSSGMGGMTGTGGAGSSGGAPSTGGTTGGVKCGAAVCGASEECCNASCSQCVPKGYGCITMACTTGGSTSLGGASSVGSTNIAGLHQSCTNGTCTVGLTPVEYYGVAGTSGPLFCSCEIPCSSTSSAQTCPTGLQCSHVADGPGYVCY